MKRRDIVRHLERCGCYLLREGGRHSIYWNVLNGKRASVPRHMEVNEITAREIFKEIDIPHPDDLNPRVQ
ncbi:MAG TPA: type II toxin-antitoxin system HicA family toxin [Candidatus Paceibacterota bacterium]|nr:type II toxin-antitoxin system HicA family toxin [Candidatus Paceibacterota bacterium]